MNDVIVRMVDELFAGVWENEEITALREEITANCLERYADQLAKGRTEAEAVEAVRESLAGMEEVIAAFPGRIPEADILAEAAAKAIESHPAPRLDEGVSRLDVELFNFDLEVRPSEDGEIHLDLDKGFEKRVVLERDGDRLLVRQVDMIRRQVEKKPETEGSLVDFVLRRVLDTVSLGIFSGAEAAGTARLSLPRELDLPVRVNGQSSDITWRDVRPAELKIETLSGDMDLHIDGMKGELQLDTKSGDLDLWIRSDGRVRCRTVSGDMDVNAVCGELAVTTVSGDIDGRCSAERLRVQTVSGDLDLELTDERIREISAQTTSGDLELQIPRTMNPQLRFSSVSGDSHTAGFNPDGQTVAVSVKTVSGDLTIE